MNEETLKAATTPLQPIKGSLGYKFPRKVFWYDEDGKQQVTDLDEEENRTRESSQFDEESRKSPHSI